MNHPVLSALAAMDAALDEVAQVEPIYMSVAEKQAALVRSARVRARAEALEMRVLAAADDVAVETGDRSTAAWVATATRDGRGSVRRRQTLAKALEARWRQVGAALAAGDVNTAQARVIAEAMDALPKDLEPSLRQKAETHLVAEAGRWGPMELARLGARVLEVVAPEQADEAEYQKLLAQERRSRAATQLSFHPRGDGSTDVRTRVPDQVANRLKTGLDGYTSPRSKKLGEVDGLPLSRRRGIAFCALLENLPASGLPRQGGTATVVSVVIDWETLRRDVGEAGMATTSTGDTITADEARRMACQAGIMPFVMSGKSVIHDQGRAKRLFTRRAARRVEPALSRVHRRRLRHPRRLVRGPPQDPVVTRRQDTSGGRHPPVPVPPPPRPRTGLEDGLSPERHHDVPQKDVRLVGRRHAAALPDDDLGELQPSGHRQDLPRGALEVHTSKASLEITLSDRDGRLGLQAIGRTDDGRQPLEATRPVPIRE